MNTNVGIWLHSACFVILYDACISELVYLVLNECSRLSWINNIVLIGIELLLSDLLDIQCSHMFNVVSDSIDIYLPLNEGYVVGSYLRGLPGNMVCCHLMKLRIAIIDNLVFLCWNWLLWINIYLTYTFILYFFNILRLIKRSITDLVLLILNIYKFLNKILKLSIVLTSCYCIQIFILVHNWNSVITHQHLLIWNLTKMRRKCWLSFFLKQFPQYLLRP